MLVKNIKKGPNDITGFWEPPKGHQDYNESPLDTSWREFSEETGFDIPLKYKDKNSKTYEYSDYRKGTKG